MMKPTDPMQTMPSTMQAGPIILPTHLFGFTFARSSGPGGQNVNKLNTKVQLEVRLDDLAMYMNVAAVQRLRTIAGSAVTTDGRLLITSEYSRSQVDNRRDCVEKLRALIVRALVKPRKRRPTKPTKASQERRITQKKQRGEIKRRRRDPGI